MRRRLRAARRFFYAAYAPEDAERIAPFVDAARDQGHLVWTDCIDAESALMDLGAALRQARAVLVFCSARAFASRAIYKQLVLAARGHKAILPLYLDDQLPPDQYFYYLSKHQSLRATEPDAAARFLGALEELERGRRKWMDIEPPAAPSPVRFPQPVPARETAAA
ncbi:MAG: toll/interleukin-1 receptor domain-containing protein [Phycisphaerales bacterium]|nr:toll/interleukin-1 receptor domain-containing protein [Hyphomonadaceae bacterium]